MTALGDSADGAGTESVVGLSLDSKANDAKDLAQAAHSLTRVLINLREANEEMWDLADDNGKATGEQEETEVYGAARDALVRVLRAIMPDEPELLRDGAVPVPDTTS